MRFIRNVIYDPAGLARSEGEAVHDPGDVVLHPGVDGGHALGPAPARPEAHHAHLQHPGVKVAGHHLGRERGQVTGQGR